MARECHHIMPSGLRCHAISLRNSSFCYFHINANRVERARVQCTAINFSPIEDLRGIQLALTQIFNLIDNPYTDTSRVAQMLKTLKLAINVVNRIETQSAKLQTCVHCGKQQKHPAEEDLELTANDNLGFLPNFVPDATPPTLDGDAPSVSADSAPAFPVPHRPVRQPSVLLRKIQEGIRANMADVGANPSPLPQPAPPPSALP